MDNSSLVHFEHRGVQVHVIDTPGAPDFLGQSLPALEAVETAAVVISATTGIEPMAGHMMQWAAQRERDRIIVVNKIDAQGVNLETLVAQIQAAFGKECLPVNLPSEHGARVIDCFYNMAQESPATDFSSVAQAHRALVEQVVEVDAAFVERYLNDGDVDPQELHACAAGAGVARRPPDPDLLRLRPHRRRRARAAGRDRQTAAGPH
ncbi:MAG: elongation factor [Ramlibacter sp.]|nr:elongation factor [Ramlibacter sp.]